MMILGGRSTVLVDAGVAMLDRCDIRASPISCWYSRSAPLLRTRVAGASESTASKNPRPRLQNVEAKGKDGGVQVATLNEGSDSRPVREGECRTTWARGRRLTTLLWMWPVMSMNRPREEQWIQDMRENFLVLEFISECVILMLYRCYAVLP